MIHLGFSADEAPHIGVETAKLALDGKVGLGVRYGAQNLQSVSNDSRIFHQTFDPRLPESRDPRRIEPCECPAISFPPVQNGFPTQTGLSAFEYQKLEEFVIVMYGHSPLLIVIR